MYLFNLVLNTGIFPDDMKLAKVTTIYKSGEKANCGNYRPISIISVVARILEKIIYNQIFYFLKQNSILANQQSGFCPLHLENVHKWLIANKLTSNQEKNRMHAGRIKIETITIFK